jgi:hypothetical protein
MMAKRFMSRRTRVALTAALIEIVIVGRSGGQTGSASAAPPPDTAAAASANIVCYGDSLTDSDYPNELQRLYRNRKVLKYAIGGEGSTDILVRLIGAKLVYPTGSEKWTRGQTYTLRANLPEPGRLTLTKYADAWPHYFQSIERVTDLQFMARGHIIATTAVQEQAAVTTRYAQDASRFFAPGHGLVNGTRLHFAPADRVPPAISPYRFYYVQNASHDDFAVSETARGSSRNLGGDAGQGLTAYGDFKASYRCDGACSPSEVTLRTRTEHDNWAAVLWMGNNNYSEPERVKADISTAVRHLQEQKRPFLVLTLLNGNYPQRCKGAPHYRYFIETNAWITSTFPNNSFDVRSFLIRQYDPTNAQDVIDHEHDVLPSSLRVDNIHLNARAQRLVAEKVKTLLDQVLRDVGKVRRRGAT